MTAEQQPITIEDPDRLLRLNRECLENPTPAYPRFETIGEATGFAFSYLMSGSHPNETRFNRFGLPRPTLLIGNLIQRPILDNHHLNWMSSLFTLQDKEHPRHCQIMERDMFRCLSRVGVQNLHKWCRIYFDDFDECSNHQKEIKRFRYLQRMLKQKKVDPLPTPAYDAYWPKNS